MSSQFVDVGTAGPTSATTVCAVTTSYGSDIYTEPEASADTLANLGPLRALAGIWEGSPGANVHPVEGGPNPDEREYVERYEAQPADKQTNGPQLFYGLRYHTHIVKPGEVGTFHDQVGYWLWEPARNRILHTVAIPRGQVVLAAGEAEPDATEFEVHATEGELDFGILSNPFLIEAFRTTEFHLRITVNPDGSWTYFSDTTLVTADRTEPFAHTDENTLHKVAEPTLNPLAREAASVAVDLDGEVALVEPGGEADTSGGSLGIGSLRS